MRKIWTKINFIFLNFLLLCGFFSLLAGCANNAPPPPPDQDQMYQALMTETPAGSIGRPSMPTELSAQDFAAPSDPNPPLNQDPSASAPYSNPYANIAAAQNPTQIPQPVFLPQIDITPQPEPDFDFSQISCSIGEERIGEILFAVEKKKSDVIKTLPPCLKLNRSLMMRAAIIDPSEFQHASDILKEDESFVHRMLEINPEVLKFAAASLRSDRDFMEAATYLNRDALQYADPKLLDNKLFMRNMIKIDPKNYMFASDRLKELPEFVQSAFADNGMLLEFAPQKIKSDKKLVTLALKSNSDALQFASAELKSDNDLKKLAIKKTSVDEEELKKFLRKNYLNDSAKKNVGIAIDNRMKYFSSNKIADRSYITKWQRSFAFKSDETRLITADSRNYPTSWKDDFKDFPILIKKIESFLLNHQVDQSTIDSLSTVYFWKVKKNPQTVVFNLYLLRDSKDIELGSKFGNVTSLTAIAQKQGEIWHFSVVKVIFDSEMKVDLSYENGHKKYNLWDLYKTDEKDKNPKIIFKVEDKFKEYFEIFEEQNNGKYRMAYRIDSLKDATEEDNKPRKKVRDEDSF